MLEPFDPLLAVVPLVPHLPLLGLDLLGASGHMSGGFLGIPDGLHPLPERLT
jgi:hypothetical protein